MGRSAARPWADGRPPHLPVSRGQLPAVCLLPGDPARVDLAGEVLDGYTVLGQNREFRVGTGRYRGTEIAVCSTGIGGPSTEIALVELAGLGVRTVIRVGGMGALRADLAPGTVAVVTEAVREGGTARHYLPPDVPARPDAEVAAALTTAAESCGHPAREITILSTDAYYLGQGRPVDGLEPAAAERLGRIRALGVDGMDMEAETVLAVGRAIGLAAGAALVVHANRATDAWLEDYEDPQRAIVRVAAEAAVALRTA